MGERTCFIVAKCSASVLLGLLFCSVSCSVLLGAVHPSENADRDGIKTRTLKSTSSVQRDITTPLTTVPTINSAPRSVPILNPNSLPETPHSWVPFDIPVASSPLTSGASWCIASETAPRVALQEALDYACGHGGVDCSAIQPGARCYNPNTLHDHASYAFNYYYQKSPIPNSCNFGGTGIITSTDPSTETCQYPSTSTSSSVLDTANQNVSTVFGAGPTGPTTSASGPLNKVHHHYRLMFVLLLLLRFGY